MSQVDDQELVLQLQGGSLDALGDLYDRHRQMVFRTALAITGDQDAACDLLQVVFLRLFRNDARLLRSYDPVRASLTTWLTIVTRSTTLDILRKKRPAVVPFEPALHSPRANDADPPVRLAA